MNCYFVVLFKQKPTFLCADYFDSIAGLPHFDIKDTLKTFCCLYFLNINCSYLN